MCVVTTNSNGVQAVECCATGPIEFSRDSQTYIGQVTDCSSFVTELYAQAIARIFILQHLHKYIVCSNSELTEDRNE